MPDGIQLPKRIERGLHAYGEQPTENDISLAKARVLASIEKCKQRPFSFANRRTWITLAAGVAVLALALASNEFGVFNGQNQHVNQLTSGEATLTSASIQAQKIEYYQQKGQTYVTSDAKGSWDLTFDNTFVYLYQNGHSQKLLTINSGIRGVTGSQNAVDDTLFSFSVLRNQQLPLSYLFDMKSKKLINLPNAECVGTIKDNGTKFVLRAVDDVTKKQFYYLYDVKTQQEQKILEKDAPYYLDDIQVDGDTLTAGSQYEIITYHQGNWSTITSSSTGKLMLLQASNGEVLYLTDGSKVSYYHGHQTVHRYDLATGETSTLLPNVHGDQELLLADSNIYSGYLISNWETDANIKQFADPQQQMGTLTLWHVTPSGETKKITSMQTTYAAHKAQIAQNSNGPIITNSEIHLYIGNQGAGFLYNLKTDSLHPYTK